MSDVPDKVVAVTLRNRIQLLKGVLVKKNGVYFTAGFPGFK